MQRYLFSEYPLLKYKVSKVYTTKKGLDFVYMSDNTTVALVELGLLGEEYTIFESSAATRDQAEHEYLQFYAIPSAMPTRVKAPTLWEKIKQLFKRA